MRVANGVACTLGAVVLLGAWGCEGPMGPEGPAGEPGPAGPEGEQGEPGEDGTDPHAPYVTDDQLLLEISDTTLQDGTATVTFTVTDSDGRPLDMEGYRTPGAISANFVLARLALRDGGSPDGYHAYTTREQTSPITDETATQPSADSDGTYEEIEPGVYTYTFGTEVVPPDPSETHRVAVYATREVDGANHVANAVFDFVPSGEADPITWEVVSEGTCNQCHENIAHHGGSRRDLDVCLTCHTEDDAIDPDTGNSIAFEDMIHKIHMGAQLPSVQAGVPYQMIGFRQSVNDYSTVGFPGFISNCQTCHQGADAEAHRQLPNRHACTSCHDTTAFSQPVPDGMVLHGGGTQEDDSGCQTCHPSETDSEQVPGITEVHLPPELDLSNPQLSLTLLDIWNTGPDETPTVQFQVEVDEVGRDILADPLPGLTVRVAGPNTDYAVQWAHDVQDTGTLEAVDAAAGIFEYTFPEPMPAEATGSYTVGLEGFVQPDDMPRLAADNPVMAFAVTDPEPVPRRTVVEAQRCNECHTRLAAHGGRRLEPNYCVMCHTPDMAASGRAPRVKGEETFVDSAHFAYMIHKIHAGEDLTQSYVLGMWPGPSESDPWGNQHDFSTVRYPRPLSDCSTCHVGTSYEIPLTEAHFPTAMEVRLCTEDPTDPTVDELCPTESWEVMEHMEVPPETAVCTSCHDSPSAAAHAELNTTDDGRESCGACHGPGSTYAADRAHGLAP